MFDKGLVNLSNFFTDDIVGNQGLEPIFGELFVFVVIMLDFCFIFGQDLVSFEVSIRVSVRACNNVVDFFQKWGVSFSELDLNFGDFRAEVLVDLSFLDGVMVESDGLDLLFESWEFFDFILDFLFN